MTTQRRVAVIGGGIAGLTAAHDLAAAGHEVVVYESSVEVGGKLRRHTVAGIAVDVGAEAMLSRRPEGVDLAAQLGLEVVHPAVASSMVWSRGQLRALPRSLMGVPLDLNQLAASGVLSDEGMARARIEPDLPTEPVHGDISVGDLVSRRFGEEVTDRLVEPLLGGVYAGQARLLSARATVPQLVEFAANGSLLEQAGALPPSYDLPVFAGLAGGMGRLVDALLTSGSFTVRTGKTVQQVRRAVPGFRLVVAPTGDGGPVGRVEQVEVDAVVLATPASVTARLVSEVAPQARTELDRIQSASVAVVTLALRAHDVGELASLGSSGFLVPPIEHRHIKAATFSFAKWAWVREAGQAVIEGDDLLLMRTSLGRHGEDIAEQATDEELVQHSLRDLEEAIGLVAQPVDAHVERWIDGLPQYAVGHLDRVARIRAAIATVPGLEICGATYDGVGIPAVIGSARRASALMAQYLGGGTPAPVAPAAEPEPEEEQDAAPEPEEEQDRADEGSPEPGTMES